MKKIMLVAVMFIAVLFTSCETEEKVQSDIDKLRSERTELQVEVSDLNTSVFQSESTIQKQEEQLKELGIYLDGDTPKYIIKIQLKQSHFSLSIKKHVKDAMNKIEFEMPVDKEFYDSIEIGDKLANNFRVGSLIMYSSWGSWNVKIIGKRME